MYKNKKIFLLILILLLFFSYKNIYAESDIQIVSDKYNITIEEEFNLEVNLNNVEVASFTLEIYYDNEKLQYINGPENSNIVNNKLLFTWVSPNGENKNDVSIGSFVFKGIKDGNASFVVSGEYYNSKGESVLLDNKNLEIYVGEKEIEVMPLIEEIDIENGIVEDNNSNLKVLRLNHVGISPEFNKDIKEYYFIANENINSLEVTAIPENKDSTVIITGNENLKLGENEIIIKVVSKDESNTSTYKIYVTKTNNIEAANANLETLAIKQGTLFPEFNNNITIYNVEVGNEISKLDILAIPQNINANVTISGNDELKIGDNKIEIIVFAEDKITEKKYEINVHRRNNEEEIQNEQEEKIEAEKLSVILDNQEDGKNEINNIDTQNIKEKEVENKTNGIYIFLIIIIVIILLFYLFFKVKKNR